MIGKKFVFFMMNLLSTPLLATNFLAVSFVKNIFNMDVKLFEITIDASKPLN